MHRHAALLFAVALVASACTGAASPTPAPTGIAPASPGPAATPASPAPAPAVALAKADLPRATVPASKAASAASAVNALGLALYLRIAGAGSSANLVYSPASIGLALAMTRPGAKGTTASQMDSVLHGLAADTDALDAINALGAALDARNGTFDSMYGPLSVTLRIANAPFGQRNYAFEPAYLDALASSFGAGLRLVDYKADPEAARKVINAWVADQTEQRIPQLIGQGVLDASSRLTLVNAIYLKAAWAHRFGDAASTPQAPFTRADGSTVGVPMMRGGGELQYASGSGWQAVELPYVGDQLAMDIVLPADAAAFGATLDSKAWDAIVKGFAIRPVDLSLPRFSTETKTDLASTLSAMGMPDAFTGKADFSGITTQEPVQISAVIHQANIDVDENGTTAAAATAVAVTAGAAAPAGAPVKLVVDHPFLFAIRDTTTGAILFIGRIGDPSVGK